MSDGISLGRGWCRAETPKAIMVVIGEKAIWVPQSVVHDDSEVYQYQDHGNVVVHTWWAKKEGYV